MVEGVTHSALLEGGDLIGAGAVEEQLVQAICRYLTGSAERKDL